MESPELTTLSCLESPSTLLLLLPFQINSFGRLAHNPLLTKVFFWCTTFLLQKKISLHSECRAQRPASAQQWLHALRLLLICTMERMITSLTGLFERNSRKLLDFCLSLYLLRSFNCISIRLNLVQGRYSNICLLDDMEVGGNMASWTLSQVGSHFQTWFSSAIMCIQF